VSRVEMIKERVTEHRPLPDISNIPLDRHVGRVSVLD
jgi:hypothetical protein